MRIDISTLARNTTIISAGDEILLSGTVYTARDAAHKRIFELLERDEALPFPIKYSAVYYAGPTPTKPDSVIGSCGPTTSTRMDEYSPRLLDLGQKIMIGKGNRKPEVIEAIVRNKALYLCALGGIGALAAKSIVSCEVIAFPELGCESIKRLEFKDFPVYAAIDSKGNSLFDN